MGEVKRAIKGVLDGLFDDERDPFTLIPTTSRGGALSPVPVSVVEMPEPPMSAAVWAYSTGFSTPNRYRMRKKFQGSSSVVYGPYQYVVQGVWRLGPDAPTSLIVSNSTYWDCFAVPAGYPSNITHLRFVLEQYNPVSQEWEETDSALLGLYHAGIGETLEPENVNITINTVGGYFSNPYRYHFDGAPSAWTTYLHTNTTVPTNTGMRVRVYPYEAEDE